MWWIDSQYAVDSTLGSTEHIFSLVQERLLASSMRALEIPRTPDADQVLSRNYNSYPCPAAETWMSAS